MYQNYIFDLYGTLLDIRTDETSKVVWRQFAQWLQIYQIDYKTEELQKKFVKEVKQMQMESSIYQYPEIDLIKVFTIICKEKNPNITDEEIYLAGEQFRIVSTSMIGLYEHTKPVLDTLKQAGKKIYLLSNAQRVFTWRELEETGLLPYFDAVFLSSDEGCKKPDPAFFNRLIDSYQLEKKETIMIGNDASSDIAGASNAGIDACYIKTAISPNESLPICKYVFKDGDIIHVMDLL